MGFNADELLQKEVFQKLGKERIEVFKTLAAALQGKSGPEAIAVIMQFQKVMANGPALNQAERGAMMEAILESLSPEEKQKFQGLLKYFG